MTYVVYCDSSNLSIRNAYTRVRLNKLHTHCFCYEYYTTRTRGMLQIVIQWNINALTLWYEIFVVFICYSERVRSPKMRFMGAITMYNFTQRLPSWGLNYLSHGIRKPTRKASRIRALYSFFSHPISSILMLLKLFFAIEKIGEYACKAISWQSA